ncbi:MAG: glycosyltransferase family 2 protein [Verrucomicrobiia bacterium]|jgi:glycosyltransferase involved in cell wall biosynthesis
MQSKPRVSFVVPALDEDQSIEQTVSQIRTACAGRTSEYEIILINDGSTDRTGQLMDEMARQDPRIRVVHNAKNLGLGNTYRKGVDLARLDYVMGVWGDNPFPTRSLMSIIEHIGEADLVISYVTNFRAVKSLPRYMASRAYTRLLNLLFGLRLCYYNGYAIHRLKLLRSIEITSTGFGYQAEILVKQIKLGHSYVEVGVESVYETNPSAALRVWNLLTVAKTIIHLALEVRKLSSQIARKTATDKRST